MKKATKYVLRNQGTSRFAKTLPHDFDDENFVQGWENLSTRALCYDSEELAQAAADADPDGDSLTVEEIEVEAYAGPPVGTYAHTAWAMAQSGMDPDEADRWKDEMKEGGL